MSFSEGCKRHLYIESEGYEIMEEEEEDLPVEEIMVGDTFDDYVSVIDQVPDIRTVFPEVVLTPDKPNPREAPQVSSTRSEAPHPGPIIPKDDVFAPAAANTSLFLEKVQKMQIQQGPFAPHPPTEPKQSGKPIYDARMSPRPKPKPEPQEETLIEKDKQRKKEIEKVIDDRNSITTAGTKDDQPRKSKKKGKKKTAGDASKKKKKAKSKKGKKKRATTDQAKKKVKKLKKIRKVQSEVHRPGGHNHANLILGQLTQRQQEAEQRRIVTYFESQRKAQNALMKCDAVEKRREKLRQMKAAELQRRAAERERKLKAIEKEREKMEEERRRQYQNQMERTERLASLAMEAKSMRLAASERRKKKAKIFVPMPRTYRRP